MIIVKFDNVKKYFPIERSIFKTSSDVVKAVDGVSFEIEKGEAFGLVGESGCGKTTLGKILSGILKPDSGHLSIKTKRLQAIFQHPYQSLDPKMKVLDILAEGPILTKNRNHLSRINETLDLVSLPRAVLKKYPHQFSGGECQRIAIARAVLTEPELIICDEPVSSLDVVIQLQILNLLKEIQKRLNVTYLFISHDLRVIKFMCGRVAVMHDGQIVEEGPTGQIYLNPSHSYTRLLLSSVLNA